MQRWVPSRSFCTGRGPWRAFWMEPDSQEMEEKEVLAGLCWFSVPGFCHPWGEGSTDPTGQSGALWPHPPCRPRPEGRCLSHKATHPPVRASGTFYEPGAILSASANMHCLIWSPQHPWETPAIMTATFQMSNSGQRELNNLPKVTRLELGCVQLQGLCLKLLQRLSKEVIWCLEARGPQHAS